MRFGFDEAEMNAKIFPATIFPATEHDTLGKISFVFGGDFGSSVRVGFTVAMGKLTNRRTEMGGKTKKSPTSRYYSPKKFFCFQGVFGSSVRVVATCTSEKLTNRRTEMGGETKDFFGGGLENFFCFRSDYGSSVRIRYDNQNADSPIFTGLPDDMLTYSRGQSFRECGFAYTTVWLV